MQRFNDDPIQNDTCADVPTLTPPQYKNAVPGQQGNDTPATESVDVDGVMVDISTGPNYDHGRKVAKRAQDVQNRSGENSDVPVLYGPCYE
ncbi:MAG: hypothetical protein RBS99_19625 [Rhodospirillales bacterium]|jgi:hypothetical protein|nr:hypothetical protein [Rhodospirillales bacterium]